MSRSSLARGSCLWRKEIGKPSRKGHHRTGKPYCSLWAVLRFGKASRSCNAIQCDVVVGAHRALIVIDDFLIRNVELKSCSQGRLYLRLFLSLCSSPTVKETEHMRKCSWNFWIA